LLGHRRVVAVVAVVAAQVRPELAALLAAALGLGVEARLAVPL
jgi:hypothetical protein